MSTSTPPTVQEFRAYWGSMFTQGDLYPEAIIQARIDDAADEISSVTFSKYYTRAVMNLAAHFLTLYMEAYQKAQLAPGSSAVSSPKGVATSVTVGDLSKTINIPEYKGKDELFYSSTFFGQEFLRLRNKMCRGGLVANEGNAVPSDARVIEGSYI